jgi:hypothetical protein
MFRITLPIAQIEKEEFSNIFRLHTDPDSDLKLSVDYPGNLIRDWSVGDQIEFEICTKDQKAHINEPDLVLNFETSYFNLLQKTFCNFAASSGGSMQLILTCKVKNVAPVKELLTPFTLYMKCITKV